MTIYLLNNLDSENKCIMTFREALASDVQQIQVVRNAVKENTLSNPALVADINCEEYMTVLGKGWVAVKDDCVVGFSIVDLKEHNIWALFVHPDHEATGIGKELHRLMLSWYFEQTKETVWLGTAHGTRAEKFYNYIGWKLVGTHESNDIKFEMSYEAYMEFLNRLE